MRVTRFAPAVLLFAAVAILAGCGSQADPLPAPVQAATSDTPSAVALQPTKNASGSRGQPVAPSPPTGGVHLVTGGRVGPAPAPPPAPAVPHFATPGGAMRYLASAYNRIDMVELKHVTTPQGRAALLSMRPFAVNLQLLGCKANSGRGDYQCTFSHDYPAAMHKPGKGSPAIFTVAPADRVGWYMTVLESCG
ncbi:MAG TPA: hypothetical protein VF486_09415 [Actinomycetes bacterium]